MGRPTFLDSEVQQSVCRECLPDYMQDTDRDIKDGERCSIEPCFLKKRALGEDSCSRCSGELH